MATGTMSTSGRTAPIAMRDIITQVSSWYRAGVPFALATLVRTRGSAPRQVGASMAVSSPGDVVGSVSGGCVEGALYELAQRVIATGEPALVDYGLSNDDAFAVGLTCGGEIQVFVQPIGHGGFPELEQVHQLLNEQGAVAIATVIDARKKDPRAPQPGHRLVLMPGRGHVTLGSQRLTEALVSHAREYLEHGRTGLLHVDAEGELRSDDLAILIECFAPQDRMYVFGASEFAVAVSRVGKFLGYHVTVCDARPMFATVERFPNADRVVVAWPHEFVRDHPPDARTVIVDLTHDPKFDVPLLELALRTNAAYVGALGGRRSHEARISQLRERGLTGEQLAKLRSPIGLDLGGRTPEETAISIAAEIIALRRGATGLPLASLDTPIHGTPENSALVEDE